MKTQEMKLVIVVLLAFFITCCNSSEQNIPLVYEAENSIAPFNVHLPDFEDLPSISTLPDPFAWSNGTGRSTQFKDWARRSMEIGAEIQR